MRGSSPDSLRRYARLAAAFLLVYGAVLIVLQFDLPGKVAGSLLGYGAWAAGGFAGAPAASAAPAGLDDAVSALYAGLTLRIPLLPWIAWALGFVVLAVAAPRNAPAQAAELDTQSSAPPAPSRLLLAASLAGLAVALVAGAWLRGENLLPAPDGRWPGSNYDEMVYYSQSELLLRGALPYRDTFMAHPPGVIYAFAPALALERPWGGVAAFVAARQWLLLYSALALPLIWLAARRLGGSLSGAMAAIVLALDGKAAFAPQSDRRLPNVGVLETLSSAAALVALALFVHAPESPRARRVWLLASGAVAAAAAMCKFPGAALFIALVVYSLALRKYADAAFVTLGAAAGGGLLALPFMVAAPGPMVRQAFFFQLLRPQEVREGVDQAARIAAYPEAQLTLFGAALGAGAIALLVWRGRRVADAKRFLWALPVLWSLPLVAVFVLGRSYHSQYYTQLVPALALAASALVSRQLVTRLGRVSTVAVAATVLLALPLLVSQWGASSSPAYDQTYAPAGSALARMAAPGEQAMAYDPGYTFAAGLMPARLSYPRSGGDYLVDSAGYAVYTAEQIDRLPLGTLLSRALGNTRLRNEETVLRRPEAQAALLAGPLSANVVVLDEKIALPKLTAQSVWALESLATGEERVGFARILKLRGAGSVAATPFPLELAASSVHRPDAAPESAAAGTLEVRSGDVVQVALYWRPVDYVASDLRVVVRFVNATGENALQIDTEPSGGEDHTHLWLPGLPYPDIRNIATGTLRLGTYSVLVRLYDPATGASSPEIKLSESLLVR